jgi:hypothetical protein
MYKVSGELTVILITVVAIVRERLEVTKQASQTFDGKDSIFGS